ncbi:MAG: carboxypeptidase-like regulatory domain-containing protein [Bryobacteraceae bacterium]|nr:carboxypeptidase-like regulatory domain-containing protein [Bryobacteraceae bacterium]
MKFGPGALAALLLSVSAFAQNGTLQGVVVDAQSAAIANAKVIVIDQAKGLTAREVTTAVDGSFAIVQLLRGTYSLRIESSGFKTIERRGLVIDPNQIVNLGLLRLEVGQTVESITVEGSVPLVETATANKSFVIDSRQVTELSLNGRDFQSLMRTLPGVVSNNSSDFRLAFNNTDQFNVNGLRGSMNNFFLDGSINTDVGANDGQYTQLSMDAVGEFKVQTSVFNAEHGRNPGILLSASTKSGGQDFHGTLYHFVRNNKFDARLPFDTTGATQPLRFNQFGGNISGPIYLPKISTRANKKAFFFFNYEGTRASRPLGGNFVDLPHPDLLNGDLSRLYRPVPIATAPQFQTGQVFQPGTLQRNAAGQVTGGVPYVNNMVPRSQWSQNAPAFLRVINFLPVAGGASLAPTNPELVRVPYQDTYRFNKNQYVARVDYTISDRMNVFYRWVWDPQRETQNRGIFTTLPNPIFPMFREKPGQSHSVNVINVIRPNLTNEAIFTVNDLNQLVDVVPSVPKDQYDREALGFTFREPYPEVNIRNRFPRFNCGVGTCGFGGFQAGWKSEGSTIAFTDNITWQKGSHQFKFGFFWNTNLNAQQPGATDQLNINFGPNLQNTRDSGNTFANMLLGNYTQVNMSNVNPYGSFRFHGAEAYAQDSWKLTRNFTLEYGVRWVYYGPTYTLGEFLQYYFDPALFDPSKAPRLDLAPGLTQGTIIPGSGDLANGMVQEGQRGYNKGFTNNRWNQFSPRVGFAWDPFGDGKTSVRGGGGVFWERIRQNNLNFGGLGNPPQVFNPSAYVGQIDQVTASTFAGGRFAPSNVVAWDRDGKTPTIYSWSLGVQRQLPSGFALDASYVGNLSRFLMDARDINQLPLGRTLDPNLLRSVNNVSNAVRPYYGYGAINFTDFANNANYNALQVRLSRRFSKSLTANASYTWSKAMGFTETDTEGLSYPYDRRRDYGPLDYDRTQILTIDYVWELPKFVSSGPMKHVLNGWQLSGITRFWSGTPLTVGSNGNLGTLGGSPRANFLGGDPMEGGRTRFQWFNPLLFARPLDGNLGNTANGILRGPGINNWDASLFKSTNITERVRLQLRFEFFNVFNHTQFAGVNTGISVPNPGQAVTAATRGRTGEVTSTRDPRTLQLGAKLYF